MAILAIDFDFTLCNNADVPEGRRIGRPMPGAKEAMIALKERGHNLVIHSCKQSAPIVAWMSYYGIPYSTVWVAEGKPVCDLYVDDRGLHFQGNWEQTLIDINKRLYEPDTIY